MSQHKITCIFSITLILLTADIVSIIITEADPNTTVLKGYCNKNSWGTNSDYAILVDLALSTVLLKIPADPKYRDYIISTSDYDRVYGFGACNLAYECSDCLETAGNALINAMCPQAMGAQLEMEDCFFRYESYDFYPHH